MLLDRLEFKLILTLVGDAAIHDGSAVPDNPGDDSPLVATIARGHKNKAVVPASTIKGALRSAAHKLAARIAINGEKITLTTTEDDVWNMFGHTEMSETAVGKIADIHFDAAISLGINDQASRRSRTAISRNLGSADEHKLFRAEAVRSGTEFSLSGGVFYDSTSDNGRDAAISRLALALLPLNEQDANGGLQLGRGVKTTPSRFVANCESLVCSAIEFGTDGNWCEPEFVSKKLANKICNLGDLAPKSICDRLVITLTSQTPFTMIDADELDKRIANDPSASIPALREKTARQERKDWPPLLWTTSFYGALRSRAAWLAELDRMRDPDRHTTRQVEVPMDDRDLEHLDGKAVKNQVDANNLSICERLFGVSGYKGRLDVSSFDRILTGNNITLANVSIDRFTGGARDRALFSTEASIHCQWKIELTVERTGPMSRRIDLTSVSQEQEFIQQLCCDLEKNGLFLGHGGSRGLGWFEVVAEFIPVKGGQQDV